MGQTQHHHVGPIKKVCSVRCQGDGGNNVTAASQDAPGSRRHLNERQSEGSAGGCEVGMALLEVIV